MNSLLSQSFPVGGQDSSLPGSASFSRTAPAGNVVAMEMEQFNAEANAVEEQIQRLQLSVHTLKALHKESKNLVKDGDRKKMAARMQSTEAEATRQAKGMKDSLEKLKRSNEANRSKPGCQKGSPVDRHRAAVSLALVKKLKESLEDFQAARASINEDQRTTVARRMEIVTGQPVAEEDLDALVRSGKSEDIMRQAVAQQGEVDAQTLRTTLVEIEERRESVAQVAQSLQELHQLMMDMALLVESQGEALDDIEAQVGGTHEEAKAAAEELETAVEIVQNTNKWRFLLAMIVLIIIIIIVVAIVVSTR